PSAPPPAPTRAHLLPYTTLFRSLLVDRGTWVRSREANVEIFTPEESGPLEVSLDQSEGAILLEGVVSTERGTYEFLGRRFELRQDRKSTRLNSSHVKTSYGVFCL